MSPYAILARTGRRMRAFLLRPRVERDLDDELRFHVDMETEKARREGRDLDDARREAERRFGEMERVKDACRDERGVSVMEDLARDTRLAARMLRRSPGFSIVVVLTLALGIGATTAIFGAVNGILLRPLPYAQPERIATLWQTDRRSGTGRGEVSLANFVDWRRRSRSFATLAAIEPFGLDLMGKDGPVSLTTSMVTEDFFAVFGVPAALGRTLQAADYVAGRHVVLSDAAWRRHFSADSSIVGRTIVLDGEPWVVAGVMPPSFRHPADADTWGAKVPSAAERQWRTSAYYQVVGRLKPGISFDQAAPELDAIARQLAVEYPRSNASSGVALVALPEFVVGKARSALYILLAAVVLVLLIGCTNVANLFLARAAAREREFTVRAALGAGRGRLVRQLAAESLLLAAVGALAGLSLAHAAVALIRRAAPPALPRVDGIAVDGTVMLFGIALSIVAAAISGFVPAMRTTAAAHGTRAASTSREGVRTRALLLIAQTALALVLLVGASLLLRSFSSLLSVDRGFRADHVLTMTVHSWAYFPDQAQRTAFVRDAEQSLMTLPGVRAVATTSSLPFLEQVGADRATLHPDDRPAPDRDQLPTSHAAAVTPGYFTTLRIPLRQGRTFSARDDGTAPRVAVVNLTLARQFWPKGDAVGKTMTVRFAGAPVRYEIVGIVGDVRHAGLDEEPRPTLFVPHAQSPQGANVFVLRTAGDPLQTQRAAMAKIWALKGSMPIDHVTTLDALLDDSLRERRFNLALLLTFALTALALAAIGIYGVTSYLTASRAHEIGVRMALGAHAADVLGMVLRQAAVLAGIGIVLGGIAAAVLSQLMQGMLYRVGPLDPWSFLGGASLLLVVALVASWIPARRAARMEPQLALRSD